MPRESQNPYHLYIRLHEIAPLRERESEWVGEAVYRCGFAAVEPSVALLAATASDERPYVPQRDRKVHLADAIAAQIELVARGMALEPDEMGEVRRVPHPARQSRLLDVARLELGDIAIRLEERVRRGVAALPPGTGLEPILYGRAGGGGEITVALPLPDLAELGLADLAPGLAGASLELVTRRRPTVSGGTLLLDADIALETPPPGAPPR